MRDNDTLNAISVVKVDVMVLLYLNSVRSFFLLKPVSVWDLIFYALIRGRTTSLPEWPWGPLACSWAQEWWSAILLWACKTWTLQIMSWFLYWQKSLATVGHNCYGKLLNWGARWVIRINTLISVDHSSTFLVHSPFIASRYNQIHS